jgi:hypothetical protein
MSLRRGAANIASGSRSGFDMNVQLASGSRLISVSISGIVSAVNRLKLKSLRGEDDGREGRQSR